MHLRKPKSLSNPSAYITWLFLITIIYFIKSFNIHFALSTPLATSSYL
ncbi:hypothetical protein P20311_2184 [Pseudoalteromonas sp. BSi20311]|nr:hypothetical protein P20311_2184 [Pseudoalteromonas sp. BSi20311]